MRASKRLLLATASGLCLAVPFLAAGCGGSSSGTGGGDVIKVTERDFKISGPRHIPAGKVDFQVRNAGPDDHEFIVVRLGASGIPLRADGMTVNEEALAPSTLGGLEPGAPGADRSLTLSLTPGRYEFFCNMEGHYRGGMHMEVVVT